MFKLQSKVSTSLLSVAAVAGLALAGVGAAHAGTISGGTVVYPVFPVTGNEPINQTMVFNQFNPTLGTLTGVSIAIDDNTSATIEITNQSSAATSFPFSITGSVTVSDPSNIVLATDPNPINVSSSTGTLAVGSAFGPNTYTTSSSATINLGALSEFIGSGSIDLNLLASSLDTVTGAGNTTSFSANGSGSVSVTYNYSTASASTPIPATGLLSLVGGLAMVGGVAIRRRFKA